MNIEKLVPFALLVITGAVAQVQLPQLINKIRSAEFALIQQTKASTWPKAPQLQAFKKPLLTERK